jgi:hypothetical protein
MVGVMIDVDVVITDWHLALDAAGRALTAAAHELPDDDLHARRRRLAAERAEVERDRVGLLREAHARQRVRARRRS